MIDMSASWLSQPTSGWRDVGIETFATPRVRAGGFDMAYGGQDWCVYYVGDFDLERSHIMLLDCYRSDRGMADMIAGMVRLREKWGEHPAASYVSGPEREICRLLGEKGFRVCGMPATVNKFLRAQRTAAAWNNGQIIVPRTDWGQRLAKHARLFTGGEGGKDDEIDALVSLWDFVAGNRLTLGKKFAWKRTSV